MTNTNTTIVTATPTKMVKVDTHTKLGQLIADLMKGSEDWALISETNRDIKTYVHKNYAGGYSHRETLGEQNTL